MILIQTCWTNERTAPLTTPTNFLVFRKMTVCSDGLVGKARNTQTTLGMGRPRRVVCIEGQNPFFVGVVPEVAPPLLNPDISKGGT